MRLPGLASLAVDEPCIGAWRFDGTQSSPLEHPPATPWIISRPLRPSGDRMGHINRAISFGLVAIPIKLYTAAVSAGVSFHLLHATCGHRIRQQTYCPVDHAVVELTSLPQRSPRNRLLAPAGS